MIVRSSLIVPVLLPILGKVIFALKGICPHVHAPLDAHENACAARDKNNRVLFYQVLNLFTSRPQTTRTRRPTNEINVKQMLVTSPITS